MTSGRTLVAVCDQETTPVPERADRPALAIFDLDRTLVAGSSLEELGRTLVRERLLSRRRLATAALQQVRFKHLGATDAQVDRLRTEGLSLVAGLDHERVGALAIDVGGRVADSVGVAARTVVDRHLSLGHFCVLLSASPQEVVDVVTRRLGLHRGIGTRAEVRNGRYTGGLDGDLCYGAGKLVRLRESIGDVDLGDAWAYADSSSDRPLLDAVGHPVAVNPDRGLRRHADRHGWPVLDLR
ncbi:MAG: HAD-IB family hydrolase [Acidimicrobiia bacterium]|nr:HAD-IB family hydrolase [Acidimicrobiia bacterium]